MPKDSGHDEIGLWMPAERAPWANFPSVIRNGDLKSLEREPEYPAAKSGDSEAALHLIKKLIRTETIQEIAQLIGDQSDVRIVPIQAIEESGFNKIPLMYAEVLAHELGLEVEYDICQAQKVMRTGATADHRLAFNPAFTGPVATGARYLVVDDTLSMGGTIASLRGYIENRGGQVVGASVMTAHEGALHLAVKSEMLARIEAKHGPDMNQFWTQEFGYGIDKLTQGEAGHLRTATSVEALRTRIHAARSAAGRELGQAAAQSGQTQDLTLASLAHFRATRLERSREGHRQALDAFWSTGDLLPELRNELEVRAAQAGEPPESWLEGEWTRIGQDDIERRVKAIIKDNQEAAVNFRTLQHAQRRLRKQVERGAAEVPTEGTDHSSGTQPE